MRTLLAAAVAMFGMSGVCGAQTDGGLRRTGHAAVAPTSTEPVTEAEAHAVFVRIGGLYKSILHVDVPTAQLKASPDAPVKKAEVVAEMMRLYKLAEPSFVFTPRPTPIEASRVVSTSSAERKALLFLIGKGFVGNYGPIATGKSQTLDIQDFGDSIGFFMVQVGQCTHVPSTKWTPYLHGIQ